MSAARTLTTQPRTRLAGLAWSRDGKSVLFSARVRARSISGVSGSTDTRSGAHRARRQPPDTSGNGRFKGSAGVFAVRPGRPPLSVHRGAPIDRVAPSSTFEADPHFSPDGRRIAFTSKRSGDVTIWVAAADGSEARQLTPGTWGWQGSPHWSPDGHSIAFDAFDYDGHVHIWTNRCRRWHAAPDHDSGGRSDGADLVARWPVDLLLGEPRGRTRDLAYASDGRTRSASDQNVAVDFWPMSQPTAPVSCTSPSRRLAAASDADHRRGPPQPGSGLRSVVGIRDSRTDGRLRRM